MTVTVLVVVVVVAEEEGRRKKKSSEVERKYSANLRQHIINDKKR